MISIESALSRLQESVERQTPTLKASGLAPGLTRREQILHVSAFGQTIGEMGQPVIPKSFFQIGSITKSSRHTTSLQLSKEEGLLGSEDPVTEYLPWSENQPESSLFCVGDDPLRPELIRFDVVTNGQAMQAILSGGVYRQTFTL